MNEEIVEKSSLQIDTGKFKAIVAQTINEVMDEREKKTRSFWRAVFDALWSGVTQAHAALQKIMK